MSLEVMTLAKPLSTEHRLATLDAGVTIAELLACVGIPPTAVTRVYINGDLVYPEFYRVVRPKRGSHVLVRVVPMGGGGGGQGKNIGQIIVGVLLVIVGAALLATGGITFGTTTITGVPFIMAGAGLILGGLLNLLLPPPTPKKLGQLSGALAASNEPESPALSLTGANNSARPWAPVPRIFGRHRVFPPYAARPYTELVGADQYLRLLFCVGVGPTDITNLRLGDTDIAAFQDVELEIRAGDPSDAPITLYTNDVTESPLAIVLLQNVAQIRTTQAGAIEISVSVAFPEGLVQFNAEDGSKQATSVSLDIDYRLVGQTTWIPAPGSPLVTTDARQSLARSGLRWATPAAGAYDVRITRTTPDSGDPLVRNQSVWTALRTFRASPAVTLPGLALVAMRIKATDQLSGVISDFNCIAHSRHLDFCDYAGTVLSDAPLAYWRLGETLGAATAFDASGYARHGLYAGSPTLGTAGLIVSDFDTAMGCDGIDDRVVSFTGLTTVDLGAGDFSVECIIRPSTVTGAAGLVRKGAGNEFATNGLGWALRRNGGLLEFCRGSGVGTPARLQAAIVANTTYHVMVTYDYASGYGTLYLDGNVVASGPLGNTAYADTYNAELACSADGYYAGVLDDVALYPVQLVGDRIPAHWGAQQGFREWRVQHTSNPASLYREVLQGPSNARPLPDHRIDLPALETWHTECAAAGRSCNLVLDYPATIYDVLKTVAACGRATPTMNDLKFAVVRDLDQTVPAQHFTPRNSKNFRGRHALPDDVHGLKVKFIDPGSDWQQVERLVFADGYDETTATKYETLELLGVTDPDHAWRLARYHLACARARREIYELETDIEYLACRRGDLVFVNHDVTEWGLAAGRIKSTVITSGAVTGVTLDETLTMEAGQLYQARTRLSDGTSLLATVATNPGEHQAITFSPPIPAPYPAVGDLLMFGVTNLATVPALVTMIRPGPDLSATLTLVDAAPGVLEADQLPIPPWDPQITVPITLQQNPPTPIIDAVVSDETVLLRDLDGSLHTRIVITLNYQITSNVVAEYLEVRYRRSDATSPFERMSPLPPDTASVNIDGVEDGVAYDLRLRTVARSGASSEWTEVLGYRVIGKSTPPPVPLNLRYETDRLMWDYPTPPLDLLGFELRRAVGTTANWASALEMHVGTIAASPFILPAIYNQWTFLLAAIDTAGNESAPVSLTVDFGDPRLHNVVESYDYKANSWPGTVTNGTLAAGDLKADQISTGFWTQDTNLFWSPTPTTLFWAGTYKAMSYVFTFTPAAASAGARLLFEHTVSASAYTFEWKKGALAYAPFPGSLETIEAVAHTFRITTDAAIIQGIISELTLFIDADAVVETQSSVAILAAGTRLTLQKTYRAITYVQPTIVRVTGVTETAISAIAVDKQNTAGANNGPLLRCYDVTGANPVAANGHVDVLISGY